VPPPAPPDLLHNPSKIFSIIKDQGRKDKGGAFFSMFSLYRGELLLILPYQQINANRINILVYTQIERQNIFFSKNLSLVSETLPADVRHLLGVPNKYLLSVIGCQNFYILFAKANF
jgi:hypothetical protein